MARRSAVVEAAAVGVGSAVLGGLVLVPVRPRAGGRGDRRRERRDLRAGAASTTGGAARAGPAPRSTRRGVSSAITGSLVVHVASRFRGDPGYLPQLSVRQGRHVYRRGFSPRKKFAFTVGQHDHERRRDRERRAGAASSRCTKDCTCGSSAGSGRSSRSSTACGWSAARSRARSCGCGIATRRRRSSSNGTPTTTTRSSTGRTRPTTTGRRTA